MNAWLDKGLVMLRLEPEEALALQTVITGTSAGDYLRRLLELQQMGVKNTSEEHPLVEAQMKIRERERG